MAERLLTRQQVADRLGLSLFALDQLIARKKKGDTRIAIPLPDIYLSPRAPRWKEAAIAKLTHAAEGETA